MNGVESSGRVVAIGAGLLLAIACAGCGEDDSGAIKVIEYDNGVVEFRDDEGTSGKRALSGEMKVALYENYVHVFLDENDLEYVLPRERVVYIGPPLPLAK